MTTTGVYYIRLRGLVQGPFDEDQLRVLAKRGQFSRIHEISQDQQSWKRARELGHLFGSSSPAAAPPAEAETPDAVSASASAALGEAVWLYLQADQQHGPVDLKSLRSVVAGGSVTPEDFVWRPGMAEWQPVRDVPELASAVPARVPPAGATAGATAGASPPVGAGGPLPSAGSVALGFLWIVAISCLLVAVLGRLGIFK